MPIDESGKAEVEREVRNLPARNESRSAGGQLLGAAFAFMGEMFAQTRRNEQTRRTAQALKQKLSECLEEDAEAESG